jgi:hypothetical protein
MSLIDWPSQKQFQTMDVPKKEISNFAHSYKLNHYIFLWGRKHRICWKLALDQ